MKTCQFCGKTFKGLKKHLHHCKAAQESQHEASSTQTTPSSSLPPSKTTDKKTKRDKSTPALSLTVSPQAKKKASGLSAPQESVNPSSSSQSLLSSSSPLRSTSTTKKKLKLADQIMLDTTTPSISLPSSPPPSLSPPPPLPSSRTLSKPKKMSLRALIEAAKLKTEKPLKGTRSASKDLLSVQTPYVMETGPSTSGAAALTSTQTSPDKDSNSTQPALESADSHPKSASKKKASQRKKAAKSLSTNLLPASPFLMNTLSMNEGLKEGYNRAGLPSQSSATHVLDGGTSPSASPSSSSRPGPLLVLPPPTLPVRVETARSDEGLVTEKPPCEMRKQNTADNQNEGVLTRRTLGQVRLRELPGWFACKSPDRPRDASERLQKGWQWYYKRYSDVRKPSVGGLGVLLAGFCVLGYMWCYPDLKLDRWKKQQ